MRVVSLVPSLTETALAWGVDVVACTRFCEQPSLRHVGGTKDPDVAAVVALAPDLVLLDREENRRDDADALAAAGLRLHVTHVTSVGDVPGMLDALATALHVEAPTESPVPIAAPRGRVSAYVPIWKRPWMTVSPDTYGGSLLAAIGVDVVGPTEPSGTRYPEFDPDEAARQRPDLVLLPSEPYPFAERHVDSLRAAVPGAAVVPIDGQDLFWWGVRTAGAMQRLGAVVGAITR